MLASDKNDMFAISKRAITEYDELSVVIAQDHIDELIHRVFGQYEAITPQLTMLGEDCHGYSIVT